MTETIENSSSLAIKSLGQVSRSVENLEESVNFYKDIMGLTHLYTFGNLAFFDINGTRLFLNQTSEVNAKESVLYFTVSNIKDACDALVAKGAELTHQAHLIHTHGDGTEEWMAFLNDLESRPLGLMSSVSKQAD